MNSRRSPNSRQARLDWGTHIMAEETVMMADSTDIDLTGDSIVVTFDAPNSFSLVVNPALPEQVRKIQWWFNMSPEGDGTEVSHEVEVDWGELTHEMLVGLHDNYEQLRRCCSHRYGPDSNQPER